MTTEAPASSVRERYLGYIACLNAQAWDRLDQYVGADVTYNGQRLGFTAYQQARQDEFRTIPDLQFEVQMLTADAQSAACRLHFCITPQGEFMGLPVDGRRIEFCEHAFYAFEHGKIVAVWSISDSGAIVTQLAQTSLP